MPVKPIPLGTRFGAWTVIRRDTTRVTTSGEVCWLVRCSQCGHVKSVCGYALRRGLSTRCAPCAQAREIGLDRLDRRDAYMGEIE